MSSFYREGGFPVEQVDECLFFGPERAVVGVDQHVPHDLTLGRAFLSTRWNWSSARWGMGDAHI